LGKALAHRKLAAKQDIDNVNVIGIYSRNRKEWFLTDWACALFGYVLAPLYDTLGK
jgi:long-subunit acyl-CoA synthetase (AMP-forming)